MANDEADVNVLVNPKDDWLAQESAVTEAVQKHLGVQKFDSILNMAGKYQKSISCFNNLLLPFYMYPYSFKIYYHTYFVLRWLGWRLCKFRGFYKKC